MAGTNTHTFSRSHKETQIFSVTRAHGSKRGRRCALVAWLLLFLPNLNINVTHVGAFAGTDSRWRRILADSRRLSLFPPSTSCQPSRKRPRDGNAQAVKFIGGRSAGAGGTSHISYFEFFWRQEGKSLFFCHFLKIILGFGQF